MRFGLGVLRLGAGEFWKMTPRELQAASEGLFGQRQQSFTREKLESLMRDFPDHDARKE